MPRSFPWLVVLPGLFLIPLSVEGAEQARRILLVADALPASGSLGGSPVMAQSPHLTTALWRVAIEARDLFRCETRSTSAFLETQQKSLADYEVIVLAQLSQPSTDVWKKAADYAKAGGQLIVVPGGKELLTAGPDKPPPGYDSAVLPGTLHKWIKIDWQKAGVTWTWNALKDHRLLSAFADWLKNPKIDFVSHPPRAWGYWDVEVKDKESVIAYYDDGPANMRRPALLEKSLGPRGRVLLFTTTMDGSFNPLNRNNDYSNTSFYLVLTNLAVNYLAEEFDLRGAAPVKGQVIEFSNKTNYKNAVRKSKSAESSREERFDEVTTKEKETEVLAVENGVATRVRVKITKDISEETRVKGKRTARKGRENRLHGQVLFGELAKGEWKYTLDDVTPTAEQKLALKEYSPFRGEDELLPKGKIKIGEQWKIGSAEFQKVLGNQLRDIKATGTGKLLRVEKDGDDTIAIMEIDFTLTGKGDDDGLIMEVTIAAKNTIHRSLKTGYDVKGIGTGKLTIKGKGEIEGEIEFTADVSDEETSKVKSSR